MSHEYQLHFIREDGDIGLTLFCAADSDEEASLQAAASLDEHASFAALEIHQGARLVGRRRRPLPLDGAA